MAAILDTVGHTPMVRLSRLDPDLRCVLAAKVETFNPGGSIKDRVALRMIEAAEPDGRGRGRRRVVELTPDRVEEAHG